MQQTFGGIVKHNYHKGLQCISALERCENNDRQIIWGALFKKTDVQTDLILKR
ncbi:MAG: hypothetical protein CM15mL7_190 [uncultured marine virus]|nr:MAG: hypothetical protein CM15mL7_190 [uncultured marine virus]